MTGRAVLESITIWLSIAIFRIISQYGPVPAHALLLHLSKTHRRQNVVSVAIVNRLLPSLSVSYKPKHAKSTLALCKIPKSQDFCLILFTPQNKTGTKYSVKGNVSKILTKFISEGKATIQFKAPAHDLLIHSEVIQLKSFLHLLKRALEGTAGDLVSYSSVGITVSSKDTAPKKLVIKSRGDYPPRGFPRSLERLHINHIDRCSLDRGILNLLRLKVLDLSDNSIEQIPEELNRLPQLAELNLALNHLHKSKHWNWLGGNFSNTLKNLNLASNNLYRLPEQIAKLHNLQVLSLANNKLTTLPAGIGKLRALKDLNVSNNGLTILPGSIKNLRLVQLDVCSNSFSQVRPSIDSKAKVLPVGRLVEVTARAVLEYKMAYSAATVPFTLCEYLDGAMYCVCGRPCFQVSVRASEMVSIALFAQNFALSANESSFLPLDCSYCSLSCYKRCSGGLRSRQPVI